MKSAKQPRTVRLFTHHFKLPTERGLDLTARLFDAVEDGAHTLSTGVCVTRLGSLHGQTGPCLLALLRGRHEVLKGHPVLVIRRRAAGTGVLGAQRRRQELGFLTTGAVVKGQ